MISHSIAPYKEVVVIQHSNYLPVVRTQDKLGKYEYANYLDRIKLIKGDWVINSFIDDIHIQNISKEAIFQIKDIQEIHYMVEYEVSQTTSPTPKCLLVCNSNNTEFWSPPTRWKLCPEVLLKKHGLVDTSNHSC